MQNFHPTPKIKQIWMATMMQGKNEELKIENSNFSKVSYPLNMSKTHRMQRITVHKLYKMDT